jgi:hypothetical protein
MVLGAGCTSLLAVIVQACVGCELAWRKRGADVVIMSVHTPLAGPEGPTEGRLPVIEAFDPYAVAFGVLLNRRSKLGTRGMRSPPSLVR